MVKEHLAQPWLNETSDLQLDSWSGGQNFTQQPHFYEQPSRLLTGLGLLVLSMVTAVGNGMILHAIRTEKRLQTVSNMFIMSLAVADLIVGLIVMPISAIDFIADNGQGWKFGLGVCQIYLSIDYTASTASIFNLFILSLDRYWSITSPLRYLRRRTKKRALVMIGLAWLASSTWVVPVLGWHYFEFGGVRQNQNDVCKTEFAANVPFKVISAIFNFYIPTTCMVVLYVRIFLAIKERSREMEKMTAIQAGPLSGNVGNVDQANDSLTEDDCNDQGRKVKNHKPPHCVQSLHRANLQGSFSSIERKHLCSEHPFSGKTNGNGHQSNNGRHHQKPPSDVETQFQRLTILAFPQSSLVQSMALSHREYSPVSQFEGVKVSVEYIENRLCVDQGPKWPSEQYVGDKNGRQICDDLEHSTHLQCYRTAKSFKGSTKICNGAMPRSRSDNRIDYELCKSSQIKEAKSRYSSTNSMKPILGNFFSRSTQRKGGGDRRNTSNVLAKEKKAATQLGVIVGAFIFCWLPYFILFMVVAYCDSYPSQCSVPYILEVSTTWCGYLNSTLNPILYPLCNKNFKIAFKRMLGSPRQVDGTLARKQ